MTLMIVPSLLRARGSNDLTLTYGGRGINSANTTSYTFTGMDIGIAAANRQVVVGVGGGAETRTLSSVKIHVPTVAADPTGTTMDILLQSVTSGTANDRAALVSAVVPSGTSAEIVVAWSKKQGRCGIGVWSLYGAATTASDTLVSTTNPMTGTIDCPAGGVIIGYAFMPPGGGGRTVTWAGITENFDEIVDTVNHSGAADQFTAAQTGLTISVTASASLERKVMIVVSFGKD